MYLLITEDGEIKKSAEIPEGAIEGCDGGYCDLIDISGDSPRQYYEGEWREIDNVPE